MSVAFETPIKRGGEAFSPFPEELSIDPEMNGRKELPPIDDLIDSILKLGQIQPVVIRKAQGKAWLVAGFSRWRAVSEINRRGLTPEPLRLKATFTQLTEQQAFIANIEENRVRNATTPMDDAYNIQRLVNVYQMDEHKIAETYRASVLWVRERLTFLELAPEAAAAVQDGRLKPSAAKAIAKLSKEHQRKVVAKAGKITAKDVQAESPASTRPSAVSLRAAVLALLAECEGQDHPTVREIHVDTIAAIREAMNPPSAATSFNPTA